MEKTRTPTERPVVTRFAVRAMAALAITALCTAPLLARAEWPERWRAVKRASPF